MPESYCCWRGDVDEYANGTGITTVVRKLKIALALLVQQHKESWENIVSTTVPDGQEATDENYNPNHGTIHPQLHGSHR